MHNFLLEVFLKSKQYSVKVYETNIVDEDKFITFFEKYKLLFVDYLIVINGALPQKAREYLEANSIYYLVNVMLPRAKEHKVVIQALEDEKQQNQLEQQKAQEKLEELSHRLQNNLKVIDTLVRSGVELVVEQDLLLLGRLNSGATIRCSGNLIVTQVVEGSIYCEGNFMMLSASKKATIVFHGVQVDVSLLAEKLHRIEFENGKISIKPV